MMSCKMLILFCLIPFNVSLCSHADSDDDGEDPRKKQLRAMFHRLAGDDNEIDAEELQDVLTTSLRKGVDECCVYFTVY